MTQRVKRAERIKRRAVREASWDAAWAKAKAEAHELWLLLGACGRIADGHDVNCRCHNGSLVLLDTRQKSGL
jgi:hypothetical protein